MRLAPSMNVYIYVVTCLKSVDDIYVIYIWQYTENKKKKKFERWRNSVTLHVKIFLITTKIFLPENYLPREWTWASPPCPICYGTWPSKTFLFPFWTWTEERKNCKWIELACNLSMLSYSDGRENHPHRGFSTEATASYSHWRGLSELISTEQDNNHCWQQYVLRDDEKYNRRLKYLCQVIEKLCWEDHSHQLRKISDHHQGLNCRHL